MKTDDPRLTAYALDELPPTERAEIEAQLREDAALAAELDATREFAARLRTELHSEESAPLSDKQRSEVLAATNEWKAFTRAVTPPRIPMFWKIAAALMLVGIVAGLLFPAVPMVKESSRSTTAKMRSQGREFNDAAVAGKDAAAGVERQVLLADATAKNQFPSIDEIDGLLNEARSDSLTAAGRPASVSAVPSVNTVTTFNEQVAKPALAPSNPVGAAPIPADPYSNRAASAGDATFSMRGSGGVALTSAGEKAGKLALEERRKEAMAGVEVAWARPIRKFSAPSGPSNTFTGSTTVTAGVPLALVPAEAQSAGVEPELTKRKEEPARRLAAARSEREGNTEDYDAITDNAFLPVKDNPLSTLSIDVDTASYANVRRFLSSGSLPPKGAVRIEEMLNYFSYDYPQPSGDAPFSATMEVAACPWTPEHRLVRIGLKGRDLARSERPAANLVFLIDVSGSMQPANKLPLVKESLRLLIDQFDDRDQVAMAVYAGASGTVLEPTRDKAAMRAALDRLQAGGSTNGAGGIQLAYELAAKSFIKGGTNRVILATDGDFNVGITNQSDLVELITKKAKSGVFLSVLGFGMGNLKDSTLEKLADKGNGNYGYIDTLAEAKKTLVEQMNGTLYTIAKDVKIQVEFNPAQASAYRLIGYENRLLAKEDFNDDKKDAGEIGAGHSVTALYEVVPAGKVAPGATPAVDELKYAAKPATAPDQSAIRNPQSAISPELLTLKLRYKKPDGDVSTKLEFPLTDRGETWEKSSQDFRWAAAVASFGMLLRDSPHKGAATWNSTLELAHEGKGDDRTGYRAECVALIEKARTLAR